MCLRRMPAEERGLREAVKNYQNLPEIKVPADASGTRLQAEVRHDAASVQLRKGEAVDSRDQQSLLGAGGQVRDELPLLAWPLSCCCCLARLRCSRHAHEGISDHLQQLRNLTCCFPDFRNAIDYKCHIITMAVATVPMNDNWLPLWPSPTQDEEAPARRHQMVDKWMTSHGQKVQPPR